ncbi:MAG: sulfurtransferase TusA family protein [Betaproteobacteria bacterium]|nr:sulfurtransferase TusA family protein [Betaproteobacteria bacterium]
MGLFGSKKKVEETSTGGEAVLSDGSRVQLARKVDCRGDSCPRPQLMTKKAVSEVGPGAVVEVMVDNPSSVEALPPMCNELNATHMETIKDPNCWRIYIKKD